MGKTEARAPSPGGPQPGLSPDLAANPSPPAPQPPRDPQTFRPTMGTQGWNALLLLGTWSQSRGLSQEPPTPSPSPLPHHSWGGDCSTGDWASRACLAKIPGTFSTQGLNPSLLGLLHGQAGSLPPCHPLSPVVWSLCSLSHVCCDPVDCSPPGSSVPGDSPGKNAGVGCHFLLQGISPSQGWNPGVPHCRRILYHLSPQGSPRSHYLYHTWKNQ